jgi:hypothetical protein
MLDGKMVKPVGWVERSDTHHLGLIAYAMGFASLYPSYELPAARIKCTVTVIRVVAAATHRRTGFLIRMDRGMGGKVTTATFGCRQDRAVLPMVDPTGTFKSRTLMATMKTSIHLKRELLNFPRLIIPCREPDWSRPPTRAVRPLPAFQAGRQNDVRSQ